MKKPRDLLAQHGLSAKKSWGQNFMCDPRIVDRIVAAGAIGPQDAVVEIGAGLGAVTGPLTERARHVWAVEHDPDMVRVLQAEFSDAGNLTILAQDAMTNDYADLARQAGGPVIVVGNLPYQITSPLLFGVIDGANGGATIARAVVLVQKEFADRAVAPPGDRTYGRLSVMVQQFAEARIVFNVSPAAFTPQPRVRSAVMRIAPRATPLAPMQDRDRFALVVKAAFGTRRKMLKNALETVFARDDVATGLTQAGVDGQRRAETLSVAEFAAVANQLTGAPVVDALPR